MHGLVNGSYAGKRKLAAPEDSCSALFCGWKDDLRERKRFIGTFAKNDDPVETIFSMSVQVAWVLPKQEEISMEFKRYL